MGFINLFVRASTLTRSMLTTPGSNIGKHSKTYGKMKQHRETFENTGKHMNKYETIKTNKNMIQNKNAITTKESKKRWSGM